MISQNKRYRGRWASSILAHDAAKTCLCFVNSSTYLPPTILLCMLAPMIPFYSFYLHFTLWQIDQSTLALGLGFLGFAKDLIQVLVRVFSQQI